MRIKFVIMGLLFCFGCHNYKPEVEQPSNDDFYEKCRKLVLSENQQGQEFYFSRKIKGVDELAIKYLGRIITAKKDTLKIINSISYTGQLEGAKHGSGTVFIYDYQGKRIGFYYVGAAWGIPSKVEKGSLILVTKMINVIGLQL